MSQNIVPVNLATAYYPPVKIDNKRTWAILHGCGENSFQRFQSTSYNNSQINITCNPPSNKNIVNRVIWIKNEYFLEFSGTNPAPATQGLLNIGVTDAARCEPIASTTNTLQVTINNDQFTTNLNQYWSALSRYHNRLLNRDEFKSMTPSFMDKFQRYAEGLGSIRNPLGSYASSADGQLLRGGFTGISNLVNPLGGSTASLTLTVEEPLNISPFLFSGEDNLESGLIGVNNMSLIFTNGDLSRLWSTSNSSLVITASVTASQAQFNYITPNIDDPLPLQQSWPYFEVTSYPQTLPSTVQVPGLTPYGSAAATNSIVVATNAIQIKAIPDKIYIFAKRSRSTETSKTTDTFASITNISMTFGNRTGLLSTSSQEQLYQMSVKNGLNMSWTEFRGVAGPVQYGGSPPPATGSISYTGTVGSVICIKPGEDVGLSPLSAPGMLENTQLTINVSMFNPNNVDTILYDLIVVIVNSGTVSMVNGSFMHQVGVFNSQDVLNSRNLPLVPYQANNSIYGGSWWDSVKNFFSKAKDTASKVISPALDVIQMLPHPYKSEVEIGRKITGLGKKRAVRKKGAVKKRKGRALVGGALMDRDMLHRRMMDL